MTSIYNLTADMHYINPPIMVQVAQATEPHTSSDTAAILVCCLVLYPPTFYKFIFNVVPYANKKTGVLGVLLNTEKNIHGADFFQLHLSVCQ